MSNHILAWVPQLEVVLQWSLFGENKIVSSIFSFWPDFFYCSWVHTDTQIGSITIIAHHVERDIHISCIPADEVNDDGGNNGRQSTAEHSTDDAHGQNPQSKIGRHSAEIPPELWHIYDDSSASGIRIRGLAQ